MAKLPKPLVSVTGAVPSDNTSPRVNAGFDRFLAIQRPVVLAHLRGLRRANPHATPTQLAVMLERRYIAAVTTSGVAVGAAAVIPGIGTGLTLTLSGIETVGFLEATALYAQSLSEIHGIGVEDPERARALVLTMMLGREGSDLVRQFAGQVTGDGADRAVFWGEVVTSSLPAIVVGPLLDRLKRSFFRQFAVRGTSGIIGRAIPFGVGAVIGGFGNRALSRRLVHHSRLGFGAPGELFPAALELVARVEGESRIPGSRAAAAAAGATASAASAAAGAAAGQARRARVAAVAAGRRAGGLARRALPARGDARTATPPSRENVVTD